MRFWVESRGFGGNLERWNFVRKCGGSGGGLVHVRGGKAEALKRTSARRRRFMRRFDAGCANRGAGAVIEYL